MTRPFAGRTALVTGASRGIGRAVAIAWAEQGGDVALTARDGAALEETAREIERRSVRAEVLVADLTRDTDLLRLPGQVGDRLGGLDALVHAAGVYASGPDAVGSVQESDRLWQVNVRAPLALTLACLDLLRDAQGDVVFLNSSVVHNPAAPQVAYAASKRALAGVADGLRARVNGDGVRVLSVYPGRTATPMQQRIFEQEGRAYHPERLLQAEDVASVVVHALSLPRTAEVTDVHVRPFQKPD